MSTLFKSKNLLIVIAGSLFLNIILWLLAFSLFPQETPAAVLHYSLDIGIDFIGEGSQIKVLPLAGLFILLGNAFVGLAVRKTDPATAWTLWLIIPIIQLLLLASFLRLWQVNL